MLLEGKGIGRRPCGPQMREAVERLLRSREMPGRYPPQHLIGLDRPLEPLAAPRHDMRVRRAVDKGKQRFDRFLEKKGFEPLEWQGARIPVYRGWVDVKRTVGNSDVYLVGDAAAQVKVSTVGGIVTGFRGARGVADAILRKGRSELRVLRRELGTHWLVRRALHHFQQEDYCRLVDMLNDSAKESLGEINRDESTRLLWNVVCRQPKLALLGLRGLLLGRR